LRSRASGTGSAARANAIIVSAEQAASWVIADYGASFLDAAVEFLTAEMEWVPALMLSHISLSRNTQRNFGSR